jgi:hypothetical protein
MTHHHIEFAVLQFENVAFADVAGDDFDHEKPLKPAARSLLRARFLPKGMEVAALLAVFDETAKRRSAKEATA